MKIEKVDDLYVNLLIDGNKVGHIEKYKGSYTIEVLYSRVEIPLKQRRLINPSQTKETLQERIYKRIKQRDFRTYEKRRNLSNSIYNTKQDFKILA